jgi:hypothetical protein
MGSPRQFRSSGSVAEPTPARLLEASPLATMMTAINRLERDIARTPREDLPALVAALGRFDAECQRVRALAWTRIMSTTIEEQLHSVRDLSVRWALSRQRVYELIEAKALPAIRIDRALRVRHRDVLAFEAARSTDGHETSLSVMMGGPPE